MSSILKKVPLSAVLHDEAFALKEVSPRRKYVEGKPTDEIEKIVYRVVGIDSYETLDVSVAQTIPIIATEELQEAKEAGEKVFVTFDHATITPYLQRDRDGKPIDVADSIKAASVKLVSLA